MLVCDVDSPKCCVFGIFGSFYQKILQKKFLPSYQIFYSKLLHKISVIFTAFHIVIMFSASVASILLFFAVRRLFLSDSDGVILSYLRSSTAVALKVDVVFFEMFGDFFVLMTAAHNCAIVVVTSFERYFAVISVRFRRVLTVL